MPTNGESADVLVDTSAAVALVIADHDHHGSVTSTLRGRRLGLAGHAAYETFSVLTRLPPPARLTSAAAARVLDVDFPASRFLPVEPANELLTELGRRGIAGGSVYDALVGATARAHGMTLATRDRRALDVYRALDVDVLIIE